MNADTPLAFAMALAVLTASSGVQAETPASVAATVAPSDLVAWIATGKAARDPAAPALRRPLRRGEAEQAIALLVADQLRAIAREGESAISAKTVAVGDRRMKWESRVFGEAPSFLHSF